MQPAERQVVIDVTVITKIGKSGKLSATLEQVRDALGDDITARFRDYATRENLDLTTQENVEGAAGKFAEAFRDTLP